MAPQRADVRLSKLTIWVETDKVLSVSRLILSGMDRKILAGGAAALIVIAGGYAWLAPSSSPEPAAANAPPADGTLSAEQVAQLGITVAKAAAADAVPLGSVPALVSLPPQARVAVTSPFPGVAVRVLAIEGEAVMRGQVLAQVRSADPVQFGGDLARAQADLSYEQARADRLAKLAEEGVVAGARADEAQAAASRTRATIAENNRLLAMAGAGRDGTATLRAPISGRVAQVNIETGEAVSGDMAPFVIENTSALRLDLQIPERLAGKVRTGMPVSLTLPGSSEVTGRILSVGASLDPQTRSIAARASIPAVPGLVPGQSVMAVIADPSTSGQTGVSVPSAAVTRIGGQDYVFVRGSSGKDTSFTRRKVTVVADTGGSAIISDGLKAGEPVAISGVAELKSLLGGE